MKGNPGYFVMKFFNLRNRTRRSSIVILPKETRGMRYRYIFNIDTLRVDLRTGRLSVAPDEPDVVQHVALAFVTSTLYLLVQPRPKDVEAAAMAAKRGTKKVWT